MENMVGPSFWNCYKGKKVLVTGHTGFKGSWLTIWLKKLGADVYGYSLAPKSYKDNFVTCELSDKINHVEGDVRDLDKFKGYFQEVQPDFAFHLAAQPLVLSSYAKPHETFEINLMGVVNFFEAVRSTPSVKVAINITSDKCYENKEWIYGYRETDAMGGNDPYSASKSCSELITASYQASFFKDSECLVASARAGNVIGGGDWGAYRIVPDYFRAVHAGEKLIIRNPHSTRPWQHVLETLSGYLNLGAVMLLKGRAFTGGWNFGPEDSSNYSVKELIDQILLIHNSGGYIIPDADVKPHEAVLLKLDISKAVTKLNWRPVLGFLETVDFTVKGYLDDMHGTNIYENRISQIELYTIKAVQKQIAWAF